MDVEQFKEDVREGRIDSDRLVELIVSLQQRLQQTNQHLEEAQRRMEELEKKLGGAAAKVTEPFSLRAEEKRQEARGKKGRKPNKPLRRGRLTTADKISRAQRTEEVFPVGAARTSQHAVPHVCRSVVGDLSGRVSDTT
jgi:transposase